MSRRLAGLVDDLRAALAAGDQGRIERMLRPRAVLVVDGGGEPLAPRQPVRGRREVAATLLEMLGAMTCTVAEVNGASALIGRRRATVTAVVALAVRGRRIERIWAVTNPEKLMRFDAL